MNKKEAHHFLAPLRVCRLCFVHHATFFTSGFHLMWNSRKYALR